MQFYLFTKPGSVPGLCTEQSHGVSKGKQPHSEITVFPSEGAASQVAWHPAPSHSQNPIHPRHFLLLLHLNGVELHRLTYHPLCYFYSYGLAVSRTWEHLGLCCLCNLDLHSNDRAAFKWWLKPTEILKCTLSKLMVLWWALTLQFHSDITKNKNKKKKSRSC